MKTQLPIVAKRQNLPSLRGSFWENWDSLWDDYDGMWMNSWFNMPTRKAFSFLDINEDSYELKYELPGVKFEEIDIQRQGNRLTVKAEQEKKEKRSYFSFQKSVTLPKDVDAEKIKAELKAGILTVTIPRIKVEEKKEPESVKIDVKSVE